MDLTQLLEKIRATDSGSTISKTSDTAPSASLNQCFEIFRYISRKTVIRSGSPGGTFLVDMKSNSVQWEVSNFTTTRSINDNGYLNQGMRNIMPRCFNRGFLVEGGAKEPYQCVRAENSEIGIVEFQKIQENLKNSGKSKN